MGRSVTFAASRSRPMSALLTSRSPRTPPAPLATWGVVIGPSRGQVQARFKQGDQSKVAFLEVDRFVSVDREAECSSNYCKRQWLSVFLARRWWCHLPLPQAILLEDMHFGLRSGLYSHPAKWPGC